MQVSVESISSLERRMTVQVPAERIDEEVDRRLKSLAGRVRVDGFRPGKVPFKVVRQRYGTGVFEEVVGDVMQTTFNEAISQEKLRPVGGPRIEPRVMEPGKILEYVAEFEVYPELALGDVTQIQIRRPVAEVTDADVDRLLETLRKQRVEWVSVEREAREGDQVKVDFDGRLDGEAFDGGKAEGVSLVLGEGRFLKDFETAVAGMRAGEEKTVDVAFPEGYASEKLAGKTAQFTIKVNEVQEAQLPQVDDAFAATFGIAEGGVAKLRDEVRANMQRELNEAIKSRVKVQVMDGLHASTAVEAPAALVRDEVERLRQQAASQFGGDASRFPDSLFDDQAKRRVALGLIIGEIVGREGLRLEGQRLNAALEAIAATYEDPGQVIDYYRSHPELMHGLELMVLEEQVVEWVLGKAQVTDEPSDFQRLVSNAGDESPEVAQ
jgi:trigger factor